MSKKKHTKRSGHPARTGNLTRAGRPSAADVALRLRFDAWYRLEELDSEFLSSEEMSELTAVLFSFAAQHGLSLAHPLRRVLEPFLKLVDGDEELSHRRVLILDFLDLYLDYLDESDAWTGSDADFNASKELVLSSLAALQPESVLLDFLDGLDHLPAVPVIEQLEALNAMTPISAVDSLLHWIGAGRPVTSTGALRLADIEPVAAMLGLRAVGVRGAPVPLLTLFRDRPDHEPDAAPLHVGTMWDVTELERWWLTLEAAGLIEITATRLRAGHRVTAWRSSEPEVAHGIRSELLARYLMAWFGPEQSAFIQDLVPQALHQNLTQLAAAANPTVRPDLSSAAILERILQISPPSGALHLEDLAADMAEHAMRHLQEMRMLSAQPAPDGRVRFVVPSAARPPFAAGIRHLKNEFLAQASPDHFDAAKTDAMLAASREQQRR